MEIQSETILIIESTYRREFAQRGWMDEDVIITQTWTNYRDPLPYIAIEDECLKIGILEFGNTHPA